MRTSTRHCSSVREAHGEDDEGVFTVMDMLETDSIEYKTVASEVMSA
jgi:hypothetical protein